MFKKLFGSKPTEADVTADIIKATQDMLAASAL